MTVYVSNVASLTSVRGFFKYKDIFQISPSEHLFTQLCHHPLVLELNCIEQGWPESENLIWHRDVWEKNRYTSIIDSADGEIEGKWLDTYKQVTQMNRLSAIKDELLNLLTLFSNHRFFTYTNEQSWFIEVGKSTREIKLGQPWIGFDQLARIDGFIEPNCEPIALEPTADYFSHHREVFDLGGDNFVELAEDTESYLDFYFALSEEDKIQYYTACKLYNDALELNSSNPSLSLIASVMAIESLVDVERRQRCEECNASQSVESCGECGLPRHRVVSKFKNTVIEYAGGHRKKLAERLYKERSKLAHGGLLRDDLFDSGFYAKSSDEQQEFRRQSLILVRDVVLNWLIVNSQRAPQP